MDAIKERKDFSDINVETTAYIPYSIHKEIPKETDYEYGKECEIVLRNEINGDLERIHYKMIGAVPRMIRKGYHWFWGKVEADDHNCCIAFNFDIEGKCTHINASFCGTSPSVEEFRRLTRDDKYPAAFTRKDVYFFCH